MVAETRLDPAGLVLPVFVKEGVTEPVARSSHARRRRSTPGSRCEGSGAREAAAARCRWHHDLRRPRAGKDAVGSQAATTPTGSSTSPPRDVAAEVGDALVVMGDLCLDEFTDHGHCGVLTPRGAVDNDATPRAVRGRWRREAPGRGAHGWVSRGMMDGQVGRPSGRAGRAGRHDVGVLGVRGEVRVGVLRAVPGRGGSRRSRATGRTYQLDPANGREGDARGRRWTSPRAPT